MSDQGVAETGGGFIEGVDPRQRTMTAEEWQRANAGGQSQPPITIVNQQPNGTGRVFTEEEVARIRQEEKDKLYGRMSEMEQQLAELASERAAREEAERQAAEAAEQAERARQEADMDTRTLLTQRETEWEQRFQALEADRERERALREQEMRWGQLQEYRRNRIEQEKDSIIEELRDYITGSTEEEIEGSIRAAQERTAAIVGKVQGAVQQQRQQGRVASVTAPPMGPMEQQMDLRTVTADDLRDMDMETYGKNREAIHKAMREARNRTS